MTRNLKLLTAAAFVLAAFAAINVSGAQAAKMFHCSAEPCRFTLKPDGTGATAHHVITIKKGTFAGSFTCKKLSGEGAGTNEESELTLTNLDYEECNIAGTPVTVDTTGCDFRISAEGEEFLIICSGTNEIKFTVGSPVICTVSLPTQLHLGIKYHNIGVQANKTTELTFEVKLENLSGTASKGCLGILGFENQGFTEGEYKTGNTLVTGETNPGGVMENLWWA